MVESIVESSGNSEEEGSNEATDAAWLLDKLTVDESKPESTSEEVPAAAKAENHQAETIPEADEPSKN